MVKHAILHEGKTDRVFLELLLQHLTLDLNSVEFFSLNNKSNFFKIDNPQYKRLKLQIEEQEINNILFILDADYRQNDHICGGCANTQKELDTIINTLELKEVSDIYITCDPQTQEGYLESLILSSIQEKQKKCIEAFLECSDFQSKENHKAILNHIYKMAYPNSPYDFKHKCFDDLKEKLNNLFIKE